MSSLETPRKGMRFVVCDVHPPPRWDAKVAAIRQMQEDPQAVFARRSR